MPEYAQRLLQARKGAKVALVHNRPVPDGNASGEIGISINGGVSYSASVYGRKTDRKLFADSFTAYPDSAFEKRRSP